MQVPHLRNGKRSYKSFLFGFKFILNSARLWGKNTRVRGTLGLLYAVTRGGNYIRKESQLSVGKKRTQIRIVVNIQQLIWT